MDPLDRAAEAAMTLPDAVAVAPVVTRELDRAELHLLAEHLVGTDMSIPDACRALRLDVRMLTLDDLDRLSERIVHCPRCGGWAYGDELVDRICPDCRNPFT
jgi:hypothetical protein